MDVRCSLTQLHMLLQAVAPRALSDGTSLWAAALVSGVASVGAARASALLDLSLLAGSLPRLAGLRGWRLGAEEAATLRMRIVREVRGCKWQ